MGLLSVSAICFGVTSVCEDSAPRDHPHAGRLTRSHGRGKVLGDSMYPLRRFAGVLVDALRSPKIDVLSTDTIRLEVRRGDVELARMNNGRYLTLMDLGRIALTLRAGFLRTIV